jgi:hypothetical protein
MKTETITAGNAQTTASLLVHPDKFALDGSGKPARVHSCWVPVEPQFNNGAGANFYLAKGFFTPETFVETKAYDEFKKANPKAAKEFEIEAFDKELAEEPEPEPEPEKVPAASKRSSGVKGRPQAENAS